MQYALGRRDTIFSAGLVRRSYVPKGPLKELRMQTRESEDIISIGSAYINKLQERWKVIMIKYGYFRWNQS